jgi:RimJ/RimL family protein N-acetyltransferase
MPKLPVLKGKQVILRPMRLSDAPNFVAWLADPEVTVFLNVGDREKPPSLKEEREWIQETNRKKDSAVFSIDTVAGEHIGVISFLNINPLHRRATYGVFIGNKKYWGQGCGTEAGRLLVDYGFRVLKFERIDLDFIAYNIRGQRSYERLGFKFEGRRPRYYWRGGHWHDQVKMGLLRSDWLKHKHKKSR